MTGWRRMGLTQFSSFLIIFTNCFAAGQGGNDVYVWNGKDNSLMFTTASRYAIRLPLHFYFENDCTLCPRYWDVPLDSFPDIVAQEIELEYYSQGGSGKINMNQVSTLVSECQLFLLFELMKSLAGHLTQSGISIIEIEGGSSTFLDKIRLMRRLALNGPVDTVCEVGSLSCDFHALLQ